MTDSRGSHDFAYVHTDIPAGMTIGEWRTQRTAERAAAHAAGRESRQRCVQAIRRWLGALWVPVQRAGVRSGEAQG
jgi:hypothetical protein